MKKVWVWGNISSTIVFCATLFYWLWKYEYGAKNAASVVHISLASFIFYALFMVERVGTYALDLFHEQFFYEMMN